MDTNKKLNFTGDYVDMNQTLYKDLNEFYHFLEEKKNEIIQSLKGLNLKMSSGWFNGHYCKTDSGKWEREAFPIPVITIHGICDIEIHDERLSISTKMKKENALAFSFVPYTAYEFEAFGVKDYLADYFHSGMNLDDMKHQIEKSGESEIGFAIIVPFDFNSRNLIELIDKLKADGFFY